MSWTPPDAPAENAIANRGEATAESGEEGEEEEEQETRPAATTAANEKGTIMRGIVPSSESVFGAKYTAFPQMVPSVAEPGISRVSGEPVTSSLGSPRPGHERLRRCGDVPSSGGMFTPWPHRRAPGLVSRGSGRPRSRRRIRTSKDELQPGRASGRLTAA